MRRAQASLSSVRAILGTSSNVMMSGVMASINSELAFRWGQGSEIDRLDNWLGSICRTEDGAQCERDYLQRIPPTRTEKRASPSWPLHGRSSTRSVILLSLMLHSSAAAV